MDDSDLLLHWLKETGIQQKVGSGAARSIVGDGHSF